VDLRVFFVWKPISNSFSFPFKTSTMASIGDSLPLVLPILTPCTPFGDTMEPGNSFCKIKTVLNSPKAPRKLLILPVITILDCPFSGIIVSKMFKISSFVGQLLKVLDIALRITVRASLYFN